MNPKEGRMSVRQYEAKLRRERTKEKKEHAVWAGTQFARVLARARRTMRVVSKTETAQMVKRYQVSPKLIPLFVESVKESLPHERIWGF